MNGLKLPSQVIPDTQGRHLPSVMLPQRAECRAGQQLRGTRMPIDILAYA